ncbi:MAG: T9SS type A sorting domain-containing protein [Candidatus Cloacimonetes bacterium]|nr:T9SS type A sorting domain-containing protein [Candidatus Cloacimonadota bacterium]
MKKILLLTFTFCLLTFTFSFADIPREYFHKHYDISEKIYYRADSVHSYDALSYEIDLQLFPSTHYISGNVLTKIMAKEDNLTEVSYELEQLNVDSVFVNGTSAPFSYDDEIITITLDHTYNIGDTLSTQVFYQGYPTLSSDVYHTGIHWGSYIFTYSDPNGARFWWPCYDHPWDKATTKMNITVPDDLITASNGILVDEIDNGDGTKTFYWDNTDPIATYLVSICAGSYATFEQDYEDIPIINYVYPGHLNFAQNDFACIPTALGIYENLYGEYPFQKYGMAECGIFGGWGGMEHQTMTSIGSGLINGQGTYEWIFVHELAHQWFGDCLTPLTWKDVWLSEGFAVYSEALYVEGTEGFQAMCDYVETSFHQYYLNWAGGSAYTTYDPPYNMYFTPATYEKPASVLHMIRLMVGDDAFFNILQTYFDYYKNGNVITTDFLEVCESVSGMDLQEFFNDWIFGSGVPSFEFYYLKNTPGISYIDLVIASRSISNTDTDFEMQIPFGVQTSLGEDSVLVDVGPEFSYVTLSSIYGEILDVQFDPHNWILNRGCTEILPVLNSALPGDNFVYLSWEEFPYFLYDSHYSIYRSETSGAGYEKIALVPTSETSYIDSCVENGNTYYYVITYGVMWYAGYSGETEFSNELSATPISFPMDCGILLIDETKNGTGGPVDPLDETVDSLYHYVLQNYSVTDYDYTSGDSISLDFISHYSTVIWHDDDFNQHLIENGIDKLASLVVSGGNLIISGWKTANYLPDFFFQNFLNTENTSIISDVDFLGAFGEDSYPYIDVNGEIFPTWNDKWPYIITFPEAQVENILYRYDSFSGNNDSLIVGLVNDMEDKSLVVLGFPLFFMDADNVKVFYETILTEFGEEMGVDDWSEPTDFTLYQNYPNPFSSFTTIAFLTAENTKNAEIKIYNVKGQLVKCLECGESLSTIAPMYRDYSINWDGKDNNGKKLSDGIYFYKLDIKNSPIKKMLLLR